MIVMQMVVIQMVVWRMVVGTMVVLKMVVVSKMVLIQVIGTWTIAGSRNHNSLGITAAAIAVNTHGQSAPDGGPRTEGPRAPDASDATSFCRRLRP